MRRTGVLLTVLVALVLGGCSADSEQIDPSGVDELVIPTPSPDPDDFVATIDNPFLPYAVGSSWRYDEDLTSSTSAHTRNVTVKSETETVAGVTTTVVETLLNTDPPGAPVLIDDYFAQDRAGNVWWFGRQGQDNWMAGVDGAQAGLAMPAVPRVGDGWRSGYLEGVVEDRLTVMSIDGDMIVLRQESDLEPGAVTELTYAKGYGLTSSLGPDGSSELSSGP